MTTKPIPRNANRGNYNSSKQQQQPGSSNKRQQNKDFSQHLASVLNKAGLDSSIYADYILGIMQGGQVLSSVAASSAGGAKQKQNDVDANELSELKGIIADILRGASHQANEDAITRFVDEIFNFGDETINRKEQATFTNSKSDKAKEQQPQSSSSNYSSPSPSAANNNEEKGATQPGDEWITVGAKNKNKRRGRRKKGRQLGENNSFGLQCRGWWPITDEVMRKSSSNNDSSMLENERLKFYELTEMVNQRRRERREAILRQQQLQQQQQPTNHASILHHPLHHFQFRHYNNTSNVEAAPIMFQQQGPFTSFGASEQDQQVVGSGSSMMKMALTPTPAVQRIGVERSRGEMWFAQGLLENGDAVNNNDNYSYLNNDASNNSVLPPLSPTQQPFNSIPNINDDSSINHPETMESSLDMLASMFSEYGYDLLKNLYESHGRDMERTVAVLLSLDDDKTNNNNTNGDTNNNKTATTASASSSPSSKFDSWDTIADIPSSQQDYNNGRSGSFHSSPSSSSSYDHPKEESWEESSSTLESYYEDPKNIVCKYFLKGKCYRKDCWYSHELGQVTCKFWLSGQCLKGETCPFRHSYDPSHPYFREKLQRQQQQQNQELNSSSSASLPASFSSSSQPIAVARTATTTMSSSPSSVPFSPPATSHYQNAFSSPSASSSSSPSQVDSFFAAFSPGYFYSPASSPPTSSPFPSLSSSSTSSASSSTSGELLTLAAKLKLEKLEKEYEHSGLERKVVQDIYLSTGGSYDKTTRIISELYPSVQRKQLPVERAPQLSIRKPSASPSAEGSGAVPQDLKWVSTGDTVKKRYLLLREEAIQHAKARNRFFHEATQAYLKGDKLAAKNLSRKGLFSFFLSFSCSPLLILSFLSSLSALLLIYLHFFVKQRTRTPRTNETTQHGSRRADLPRTQQAQRTRPREHGRPSRPSRRRGSVHTRTFPGPKLPLPLFLCFLLLPFL
ncbi:Zinc finger CCCH domain-containing protein 7 [Balamuthia mandrillaris]